jgi:phage-related protein
MELEGFRVPEYNEDGTMRSQLFGKRATLNQDDMVVINDLRIEFYGTGKSNAIVTAPHCVYDRASKDAESEGSIQIDMAEMTITGRGYTCSGEEKRFTILNDAKVVLKNVQLGLKDNLK